MTVDPVDRAARAQLNTILLGAEQDAYTLPESLHAMLRAEVLIGEQVTEARAELARVGSVSETTEALAGEVVDAARDGRTVDDLADRIAEAEVAERKARLMLAALEQAQVQAGYRVITDSAGATIIASHLRPALDELKAQLQKLGPKLAGYDVTAPETFLRAPEATRKAYNDLQDAVARYRAMRNARRAASALDGGPTGDRADWFSELRAPDAVGVELGGRPDRPQPYPSDAGGYLLWLATVAAAEWWMPLPQQQDAALADYSDRTRPKRPRMVGVGSL